MEELDLGVLFILGASVFGGMLGAWLSRKLRAPQVIGYIVFGLLVGESGLRLVTSADIETLQPLNLFALGIIGFLVGGELRAETFKRYARQFTAIVLGEGIGAFILVGTATGALIYTLTQDVAIAVSAGAVFGAIASATDPASTMDVLWEYRCRGVLTKSTTAVVALDDALAMTLYGIGTGVAGMLMSDGTSITSELMGVAIELFGAILLGAIAAGIVVVLLRFLHEAEKTLAMVIGLLLLTLGICVSFELDVILAAMTLGVVVANVAPRRSEDLFKIMRGFSTPIYVLFFVFVGARIALSSMPPWLWALVGIYVVCRSVGKMGGAYLGARLTKSPESVRRYLGFGLFTQGGVAVGLSIIASQHLTGIALPGGLSLGDAIITGVTATTLIVQFIGPPMVKLAARLADEAGRDVVPEDVIASWAVRDVMDADISVIREDAPLSKAVQAFAVSPYLTHPVTSREGAMIGTLSLEGIKEVLSDQDAWQWLVASDAMLPVQQFALPEQPLKDVLQHMSEAHHPEMPVVDSETRVPQGIIELARTHKKITKEVLRRQTPETA